MSESPGADRLHLGLAIAVGWLLASSPWLMLYRRLRDDAGWIDWSHVAIGVAVLPLALAYAWTCLRGGRRGVVLPIDRAGLSTVGRDLAGLARGRIPSAEGGGLFGLIEGLLLFAVLATAVSGLAWLLAQGGNSALGWREAHLLVVRGLAAMLVLHVVGVTLHLFEFLRS